MLAKIFINLIGLYQRSVRLILPPSCRFIPSCSEYAKEAVKKYGLAKGGAKAMVRIFKCHPFSGKAGYDPLL